MSTSKIIMLSHSFIHSILTYNYLPAFAANSIALYGDSGSISVPFLNSMISLRFNTFASSISSKLSSPDSDTLLLELIDSDAKKIFPVSYSQHNNLRLDIPFLPEINKMIGINQININIKIISNKRYIS